MATYRLALFVAKVIRLLLTMVPHQRTQLLREEGILYQTDSDNEQPSTVSR